MANLAGDDSGSRTKTQSSSANAHNWNLAAAFVVLFSVIGIPAILVPVLYAPILDETGWSRGDVAMLSSVKFMCGAIACFFTGHAVEKWGVRKVTLTCAAMAGLGTILLGFATSLLTLYIVGALLGVSALGVATGMKIFVSQWFSKRQGLAVGAALMGTSMAGVFIPGVATWLVQDLGWRVTAMVMGAAIWLIAIPFFAWKAREATAEHHISLGAADKSLPSFEDVRFTRNFFLLIVANLLIGMVDHGVIAHYVIFLDKDVGLGATVAAIGFTGAMVMSNIGKLSWGWTFDRFSARGAALCWLVAAAGLIATRFVHDKTTMLIFIALFGISQGGMLINMAVMARHYFGPRAMAKSIAIIGASFNLGAAFGPGLLGYLHDSFGNYHLGFGIMAASSIAAAFVMLLLGDAPYMPRNNEYKPKKAQPE